MLTDAEKKMLKTKKLYLGTTAWGYSIGNKVFG